VNDVHIASGVLVNTSSIVLKRIGNSDTASNGSALIDLLHHVLLAGNGAVLVNLVNTVLLGDVTRTTAWLASLANVDRCAINAVIVTTGLVDGACLISDVVLVHKLEC
jgi:hypothetical protein